VSKAIYTGIFLLIILGLSRINTDDPEPVIQEPISNPAQDSLQSFLDQFESKLIEGAENKRLPGGAYVITYKDEVLVAKGFGTRDVASPLPIDENTVFRLGSVSKGFASVLTGMMVDQGLLTFDAPVYKIVSNFKLSDADQTERIEVQHLLSHTTGLPRHAYTNLVEDGLSLERIIPKFEDVPLISLEGEQQAYTNAAYAIIETVLEHRTNVDFNTLLQEEIFNPLKMDNASSTYSALRDNTNKALPHLYSRRAGQRIMVPIKNNYFNAVSAGGINASVSDMGKWLLLLTGNRPDLIKEETLDQIFEPVSTIPNRRFSRHWPGVNESYYGMGWRTLNNGDQTIVYHGGFVNGYRSEIAFDRENQIGISILFHSNTSYAVQVIPEFFNDFSAVHEFVESHEIKITE
jgi:beta-lactamase class C